MLGTLGDGIGFVHSSKWARLVRTLIPSSLLPQDKRQDNNHQDTQMVVMIYEPVLTREVKSRLIKMPTFLMKLHLPC